MDSWANSIRLQGALPYLGLSLLLVVIRGSYDMPATTNNLYGVELPTYMRAL